LARLKWRILLKSVRLPLQKASEYEKAAVMKSLEMPSQWAPENDNPNTTQTLEYTKDKYNVKIIK
jgi:hypothetical protein